MPVELSAEFVWFVAHEIDAGGGIWGRRTWPGIRRVIVLDENRYVPEMAHRLDDETMRRFKEAAREGRRFRPRLRAMRFVD